MTASAAQDIAIRATVTKTGDAIVVDLTESDPQVPSFLNSSWPNTVSAVPDGHCLPARSGNRQERWLLPPHRDCRQGRHDCLAARGCTGDHVHVPLLE